MAAEERPDAELRPTLVQLGIELTTQCNSHCRHCFARAGFRKDATLAPERVRSACAEGYRLGCRQLHLTGGEPLLWNGLWDLLETVFQLGYRSVFMNSNGLLLDEQTVVRLSRYPGLALSVSLDGPPVLHDAVRGRGAYHRTSEGIRLALAGGLPLRIFTVVGKSLLGRLSAFAVDLDRHFHGIACLTLIQMIQVEAAHWDLSRELLAPEDFLTMTRVIAALNLCGLAAELLNDPLVNVAASRMQLPAVPRSHPLCRPGKLMIHADGEVTLAHSAGTRFGLYVPGVLEKVLTGSPYARSIGPDAATCPDCRYVRHCRPNGMHRPSGGEMDAYPATPYCQRVMACIDRQNRFDHP